MDRRYSACSPALTARPTPKWEGKPFRVALSWKVFRPQSLASSPFNPSTPLGCTLTSNSIKYISAFKWPTGLDAPAGALIFKGER